jgi:hypothetical protein
VRSGPLAGALFGSLLLACGRTDLATSFGGPNDAGTPPDATATQTTPSSTRDAGAIHDASDVAEGGSMVGEAGAAACYVGQWSAALPMASCRVAVAPTNNGCGPSQYRVTCGPAVGFTPPAADGCVLVPNNGWGGETDYCCPCLSADAGAVCVDIDVSTYDHSCTKDSDCIVVSNGMICPGWCACPNAAINVDGQMRIEQAVAPLQSSLNNTCACPSAPVPVCRQGVCLF